MKITHLIALVPLLLGSLAPARPALEKPNVIVVLLDDAGNADFSHTGNPTIKTPEVSRLVSEGMNFPQFYSASPACSAARYALLTGRNPLRSGLGSWVLGPESHKYIHPKEVTLAEGLKARGYATAIFGKWHLGMPNQANQMAVESLPLAHGFDAWFGTPVSHDYEKVVPLLRGNPQGTVPVAGYEQVDTDVFGKPELYATLTRQYTDHALKFIEKNAEKPFFLYLTPNMPHLPVQASDAFKGKSRRGLYGDAMEEIDFNIGRIRETLEREGIEQNTLIILSSDNGPWIKFQHAANDPKYGEARELIGSALPFRDGKGSTWEGGQRVPGVWWWPGTIKPGTIEGAPASQLDIVPTVFALTGEPLPKDRTLDGRDIRPYLNAKQFSGKVPIFRFCFSGFGDNSIGAVRVGPWKLHTKISSQTGNNYGFTATPAKPLLFNVEKDPGETIDRAAQFSVEATQLQVPLNAFLESCKKEGTFWDRP